MKSVMKIMIVLGVTLVLLGVVASCEQKGGSEEKSGKVNKSEKGVLGKYVNQDDPRKYVELKSDYTVYKKDKFPWGDYYEMKGKWETGSDEVLLIGPLGGVDRCKIKGNTLIDEDGKIWTKQGEAKEIAKEKASPKGGISKDSIPGRYIVELVKKDGTIEKSPGVMIFKRDGRLAVSSSGSEFVIPDQKWEFKNGAVHIYQYFSDEPRRQEILFGRLKGSTIICKIKDDKEVDELRYIRED